MNYLDIIISLSLLYGFVKGYSNGIIREITNISSVVLALYVGVHFSELIHPYLNLEILSDYSNAIPLIAFLIVFIIILVIIKSLGELINGLTKMLALGLISRFMGAIFGLLKLLIICCFFLIIANQYQLIDSKKQGSSVLITPLQKATNIIAPEINKHKENIIEATKETTKNAKDGLDKKINP